MILLKLLDNYLKNFVLLIQQQRKFLQKLVFQSKIFSSLKFILNFFCFSKIVVHQPKRFQSKFEEAFQVVEAVGDKVKSYIQDKM
jgi:hypothetical protein